MPFKTKKRGKLTYYYEGEDAVLSAMVVEEQADDDVRIFPGHDYIENNLEFTLDREPNNKTALSLREKFKNGLDAESFVSNIGLERQINVFFRLNENQVREGLASSLDLDVASLDNQKTFIGLRKLRDSW